MTMDLTSINDGKVLRYGMFVPLAFMIASLVSSCFSYSNARQNLADDLNEAILAFANENREVWTRQDTIAALRKMHETTHKPVIYQASDVNFRNATLKDDAYFTIALVDKRSAVPKIKGNRIASDSIMLVPENNIGGIAVRLQGFADCSMASVFATSDLTLPGVFFSLSLLSIISMFIWRRKEMEALTGLAIGTPSVPSLAGIKLTPMQRQLAQMLLEAPEMKVDKSTICAKLWSNKSNAEESLYTLVKRTKAALADTDIEIVCNRGDSYELRITH